MSYLSMTFAAFVMLLMVIYYLLPVKARGLILLLGSLMFYGCFDLRYSLFLLTTAVSTFICAGQLLKAKNRRLILASVIVLKAGIWFVIKELHWALHTFNRALSVIGISFTEPVWSVIVPVGISYYIL